MANVFYQDICAQPGEQRDGTLTDTALYTSTIWTRFIKNRPVKMGGYQLLNLGNSEIIRNLYSLNGPDSIILYVGQPSSISWMEVSPDLSTSTLTDVTPPGFVANVNNTWSMTTVPLGQTSYIVATACPNGLDISNMVTGLIYASQVASTAPMTALTVSTDGGVMNLGSYLLYYGSNGYYAWSSGTDLTFPGNNFHNYGTSKFVYGAPIRSGSTSTGLLWSLDAVVQITYEIIQDTTGEFVVDFTPSNVSTITTILSVGSIVSYDPYFYWIGSNTFFVYNGAVQEIQNTTNKQWFFDNLTPGYKERVVGYVNKRYDEIHWEAPMFGSTENNYELVYSITMQQWWSNPLTRSAAASSSTQFPYPILSSSSLESINGSLSYPIWAHEVGVNRVQNSVSLPITASFTTNRTRMLIQQPEAVVLSVDTIVPDVVLTGNLSLVVNTQGYPNSPIVSSEPFIITPDTEFLTIRFKGTLISYTITSNELDGNFFFGQTLVKYLIEDDQRPGPSAT